MTTFGARLDAALAERGPLCVGIDPHPELLSAWDVSLDRFADICVEAFAGTAALVKPQVAFFEAQGSAGLAVLERTTGALRESGTLVLADAKRGDIGSTMAAYARAWLGDGPLAADAMTVSPYLGFGSLRPVLDLAEQNGRGVFVLAATSNPEGAQVQLATDPNGRTIAQTIVDEAARCNAGAQPLGSVGVVIGATLTSAPDLSALNGPVLMPGVGVQGGGVDDVRRLARTAVAVPSVSREVLRAGPSVGKLRDAVQALTDEFALLRS